jgi:hypothetical protein
MQFEISKCLGITITDDMDFLQFSYFYDLVLNDIKQSNNQNNELGKMMGMR